MKKIFCLLLALCLVLAQCVMLVFAEPSENLVSNGDFELGEDDWKIQSNASISIEDDGSSVCFVYGRQEAWASPSQDLTEVLNQWGPGQYELSARVKVDKESDPGSGKMLVVLNSKFDGQQKWLQVAGTVNADGYTTIKGVVDLPYTEILESALLYLQSSDGELFDYYCDDFSVKKVNGKKEPLGMVEPYPVEAVENRPEETLVGAIRWDAWLNPELETFNAGEKSPEDYIGAQMVRSLSPTQYHFRMPYFGIVESATKITFPDYTQEIFDQEMLYAKEAGIDYFMYCWYADGSGMDTARQLHTTSQYRDDVKMTAMWDISALKGEELEKNIALLKESFWLKVADGRPVVYVNNGGNQTTFRVNEFREACMEAGLKNPYIIGIEQFGSTPANCKELGLDAFSDYAIGLGDESPYSKLAEKAKQQWLTDTLSGVQYIPLVPTGWDRRPRIDHPVSWEGPTSDKSSWTETATAEEIAALLQDAIDFNNEHKEQSNINSVLIYAWNEHDEGGWLCPTIIDEDRDGMPELREDGTYKRDTRRLRAIQKVLRPDAEWTLDADEISQPAVSNPTASAPATSSDPSGTPSVDNGTDNKGSVGIYIAAGVAGVVIIGAVVILVVQKKKKQNTEPENDTDHSEN